MTWHAHAACLGMENAIAIFFPPRGAPLDPRAVATCAGCCVHRPCLEEALALGDHDDAHGYRGRHTAEQRREIRRRRRRGAA